MNLIEFHGRPHAMEMFPRPHPAVRAVPEWYKNLATKMEGPKEEPTLKRCPPFLEAMVAGYVIPVPATVQFVANQGGLSYRSADARFKTELLVQTHDPLQYRGAPFDKFAVLKYLNPWVVKTPPGYSTLFISPINRYDTPLTFFSGVVETDTYYQEVHFPFVCTLGPGQGFTLAAGAPLMQVIPFRRDAWESTVLPLDEKLDLAAAHEMEANRHAYKDRHWKRTEYT